jgi:transitional endoplasmic reticulum ATPase
MKKQNSRILSKGELVNNTYEVQFFIGEGAFGEVYRVKHKYLGLQVLKVFKEEYAQKTDIKTLVQEAKLLSGLTHENIVRVFEANEFIKENKVQYYITMDFVSGETLNQRLSRLHKLPYFEAISIQSDLLNGLKFLHEQNPVIIHRDINLDNLLLSYDNKKIVGKLSDFGLAQTLSNLTQIADAAGRYNYFAPECFWGTYLTASDVFSAGLVFYQMLTGVQPWKYDFSEVNFDDIESISTCIISARRVTPKKPSYYNPSIPADIDNAILKSIEINLASRFHNAIEFYDAMVNSKKVSDQTNSQSVKEDNIGQKSSLKPKSKGKGFDDIAGMSELKETLYNDVILPLTEKELYEQYKVSIPNGMMLYGPPGCGKTFISRKFAEEINFHFIELKPSDLASIYVHGTQEKIGQVFKEAREKAPTVIFIDELDAIMPNREGGLSQSYAGEVNEFLAQMTECHKDGIFILAATNRPEKIDPAILRTGRIDKVIYLPPPDYDARLAMFKLHLKDRPIDDSIDFEKLSNLTSNYVSSDINFLVNEASRNALKERIKISQQLLENVIHNYPPSVSERQIHKYEVFRNNRNFS